MKMKNISFWLFILFAIASLFLGGCATEETVNMADSYNDAYISYIDAESRNVGTKSNAIKEMLTFDCEDNTQACGQVKAMAGMIAAERIAGIKSNPFTLEKHATDVDAQISTVKMIGSGIPFITMGIVATKAIEDDKGTVNNTSDNGSTVNNSYDEDHATNLGDDSTAGNYPDQDNETESVEVAE